MAVDLEQMMILLQRRYNCLKEIDRLTDELQQTFARHDEVSASLLLEMRAEQIADTDTCMGQIWDLARAGGQDAAEVRRLMRCDPFAVSQTESWEENKIFQIRQSTVRLLEQLQEKDRALNLSVGREKSFYKSQ